MLLSLASGVCPQGPAPRYSLALACDSRHWRVIPDIGMRFPSLVGSRGPLGAFVNAQGVEGQLHCASSLAVPSCATGRLSFSRAMALHTAPSSFKMSLANRMKLDLVVIPTGAAQLPARSVLCQLLAALPSHKGVGSTKGRLAQAPASARGS